MPAALGMTAGILAESLGGGFVAAAVCLLLFILLYVKHLQYPAFFALMAMAGTLLAISHRSVPPPEEIFAGKHKFVSEVLETNEGHTTTTYLVKVTRTDGMEIEPFVSAVTVNSVLTPRQPGAIIEYSARLRPMERKEEVPHETDYAKYMIAEGIHSRCMLDGAVDELAPPHGLRAIINHTRDLMYNAIVDSPIGGSTAAFLVASILGDRRFLTSEEYEAYRDTGVAHILALSGLHVGIIASILGLMMLPLRPLKHGIHIGNLIAAITIWIYALIAGFTPSIIRASVMITVFIAARMIQRGANGFNSLFLAIVVILCINPGWLFTPGFQLSVSAVASILMFVGAIPAKLRRNPPLWHAANLIVIPIAAMLGTGIISAFYFNIFPLLFLAVNIVTGILFPFILGGGLILAAFTYIGINFMALGHIVDLLYRLMQWSITSISSVEGSSFRDVYFSAWIILPYTFTLLFLAAALRYKKKAILTMTGVMAVSTLATALIAKENPPLAELYIPTSLKPTGVIMRAGNKAWLFTGQKGFAADNLLEDANVRYRRYLLSRGCGESFIPITDTLDHTTFKTHDSMIAAIDKTIAIVGERMPCISGGNIHVDYALICDGYKGSVDHVLTLLNPDTLLLAPDMHPSRRSRMIRLCGDTIPYRNLAKESFSIIK